MHRTGWIGLVSLFLALPGWAAPASVNIAGPDFGTRIVADTQFGEAYAGSFVADGVIARGPGGWFSQDQTQLPCALTFTFAATERLEAVVLHQSVWDGSMYHSRQVAVEVSRDGAEWTRVTEVEMPDESAARVEVPLGGVEAQALRLVVLTSYVAYQTCGFAEVEVLAGGRAVAGPVEIADARGPLPASLSASGIQVLGRPEGGPQAALTTDPGALTLALEKGESLTLRVPLAGVEGKVSAEVAADSVAGSEPAIDLRLGDGHGTGALAPGATGSLSIACTPQQSDPVLEITATAQTGPVTMRWLCPKVLVNGKEVRVRLTATPGWTDTDPGPPPVMPALRPALEQALVEWDWRLQDGIGTPRGARSYAEVLPGLLARGAALLERGGLSQAETERWRGFARTAGNAEATEALWREAHVLLRELLLSQNGDAIGPLVFVKQVPPVFSHQLTQYYGRYARPGGGVFVLERPGESMRCRELTAGRLPLGSAMHPELSPDGTRVLFAFAEAPTTPANRNAGEAGRYYHLYSIGLDGDLQRLTDGPYNDFSPRYLPDGRIVCISTRRDGWHRCGSPGCENYTLAIMAADGTPPRPVSYHETQEWDPAVLDDGRIVYTRWDYVDRHAIFYEQLWTVRTDGSAPSILYGNNTFNPVGIWEPRQVPGSHRLIATAAPHHGMTAGSIILVDSAAGVDGPEPIERLTPDVPFPESESLLRPFWRAPLVELANLPTPPED